MREDGNWEGQHVEWGGQPCPAFPVCFDGLFTQLPGPASCLRSPSSASIVYIQWSIPFEQSSYSFFLSRDVPTGYDLLFSMRRVLSACPAICDTPAADARRHGHQSTYLTSTSAHEITLSMVPIALIDRSTAAGSTTPYSNVYTPCLRTLLGLQSMT